MDANPALYKPAAAAPAPQQHPPAAPHLPSTAQVAILADMHFGDDTYSATKRIVSPPDANNDVLLATLGNEIKLVSPRTDSILRFSLENFTVVLIQGTPSFYAENYHRCLCIKWKQVLIQLQDKGVPLTLLHLPPILISNGPKEETPFIESSWIGCNNASNKIFDAIAKGIPNHTANRRTLEQEHCSDIQKYRLDHDFRLDNKFSPSIHDFTSQLVQQVTTVDQGLRAQRAQDQQPQPPQQPQPLLKPGERPPAPQKEHP